MLGKFLRWFCRFLVRRYYRRVLIEGTERIPTTGPVLICANHPNSLFDPAIVGMAAQRPVRFLAKAPLFRIPILGALMSALGMIPAFRGRDSRKDVGKNNASLNSCAEMLKQGEVVGVFPEGLSHDRIGLEMVRSGAARIAQLAIEDGLDQLTIVPVGLNFVEKERFRSDLWVTVGDPISLLDWLEENPGTEKQQQRKLTEEIGRRLKDLVIHLDDEQWEPWLELIEKMHLNIGKDRSETAIPIRALERRAAYVQEMNQFIGDNAEDARGYADRITALNAAAEKQSVSIESVAMTESGRLSLATILKGAIVSIILKPFATHGFIHHAIPFFVTRLLAGKYQSKTNRTDISLYRLLFSLPIYGVFYLLIGWGIWLALGPAVAIIWTILAPITGILSFEYWPRLFEHLRLVREWGRLRSNQQEIQSLRQDYALLISDLNAIVE